MHLLQEIKMKYLLITEFLDWLQNYIAELILFVLFIFNVITCK